MFKKLFDYLWKKEDLSWMDKDYLKLEECDNSECKKEVYSTCNIYCIKCDETNELKHETIYHCLDCVGQAKKFINSDKDWDHGFDLCKKCFKEDPDYETNNHLKSHNLKKVERKDMIHVCKVCEQYFCSECLITSSKPIKIEDCLEDGIYEDWTISICKKCIALFNISN